MRRGDARTIHKKSTVHRPKNMTPYELQMEHIKASKRIYSVKRLINALIFEDVVHKALFIGFEKRVEKSAERVKSRRNSTDFPSFHSPFCLNMIKLR